MKRALPMERTSAPHPTATAYPDGNRYETNLLIADHREGGYGRARATRMLSFSIPRDSKAAKERDRGPVGFSQGLGYCCGVRMHLGQSSTAVHLPEPVDIDDLHGSLD